MIIYYNAKCSKCRDALTLLEGAGCEVELRNYIAEPPSEQELSNLIAKLGCKAEDIIRKDELPYKEFGAKAKTEKARIKLMCKYPSIIQRPIVIDGNTAVIGRPPELVLSLVKAVKKKKSPSKKRTSQQ